MPKQNKPTTAGRVRGQLLWVPGLWRALWLVERAVSKRESFQSEISSWWLRAPHPTVCFSCCCQEFRLSHLEGLEKVGEEKKREGWSGQTVCTGGSEWWLQDPSESDKPLTLTAPRGDPWPLALCHRHSETGAGGKVTTPPLPRPKPPSSDLPVLMVWTQTMEEKYLSPARGTTAAVTEKYTICMGGGGGGQKY